MSDKLDKVTILAIGGGGGRIAKAVGSTYATRWAQVAYLDTDVRDLEFIDGVLHVPLGQQWTHDQSCGDDPLLGQRATEASLADIRSAIGDAGLLIVVTCLGGGTGSGGAPVIARLAKEMGILSFFVVCLPMAGEGNGPRQIAEAALATLRRQTEVVVAVPVDLLFSQLPAETQVTEAFNIANAMLARGLAGLAEVVRCRGIIPIDFSSLRTVLAQKDAHCAFGVGEADDEQPFETALDDLYGSPLLGGNDFISQADVIVATLVGGDRLQVGMMNAAMGALNSRLPATAKTYLGANHVPELGNKIQVTMLAIRYRTAALRTGAQPAKPRKSRPDPAMDGTRQFKLPFVEEAGSTGIFGNTPPTLHLGENLDIPTFQRRGIDLGLDES